jgi:serine/threonine-protein kinase
MGKQSSDQGEQFLRLARDKGLLQPEQVKDCIKVFAQLEEIGMAETIPAIAVKKGYLNEGQKDALMKELAHEAEAFPYEIGEEIGQGSIGVVYSARQKSLDRLVALKILKQEFVQNKSLVDAFLKEARASAKFNHVNIVQGIDAGPYKGTYYFAMELVDGHPLDEILSRRKKLKIQEAASITVQTARALEYAEKLGMVHRDVKPDNILVAKDGTAKLCDLGMARLGVTEDAIKAGTAIGTPYYMSPEQARGATEVDVRSDIYSLGASMYHMLTGEPPFKGLAAQEVLKKQLTETIPDPRTKTPELPAPLAYILAKMMAKDPKHRYHHAKDVQRDLELFSAGKPIQFAATFTAESTVALKRDMKVVARKSLPYVGIGIGAAIVITIGLIIALKKPTEKVITETVVIHEKPDALKIPDKGPVTAPDKQQQMYDSVLAMIAENPKDDDGNIERLKNVIQLTKGSQYEKLAENKIKEITAKREAAAKAKLDKILVQVEPLIAAGEIDAAREKIGQLIPPQQKDEELVKLRDQLYKAVADKLAALWQPYAERFQKAMDEKKYDEAKAVLAELKDNKITQLQDRAKLAAKKIDEAEAAEKKKQDEEAKKKAEERKQTVEATKAKLIKEIAAQFAKRDFAALKSAVDLARVDFPELEEFLDSCARMPAEVEKTLKAATETAASKADQISVMWKGQAVRGKVGGRDGGTIYIVTSQGMRLPVKVEELALSDILTLANLPDSAVKDSYLTAAAASVAYGDNERARKYLEKIPDNKDAGILATFMDIVDTASVEDNVRQMLAKADAAYDAKNWINAEAIYRKVAIDYAETSVVKELIAELSEKVYKCFAQGEDPWQGIYMAWVTVLGPARLRLTYDFVKSRGHADDWDVRNAKPKSVKTGIEIETPEDKDFRLENRAYMRSVSSFWCEGHFEPKADKGWLGIVTGQLFFRFWPGGGGAVWVISKPEDWQDKDKRQEYKAPPTKSMDVKLTLNIANGKVTLLREDKEIHTIDYKGPSLPVAVDGNGTVTISRAVIEGTVDPTGIKEWILKNHLPGAKGVDNGVRAQFFKTREFKRSVSQPVVPNISFEFKDSPIKDVPDDGFSITITGGLLVPEDGDYVFYSQGNGSFRLILQGKLAVQRPSAGDAEGKPLKLKRGVVPFVAEYIDEDGETVNKVQWSGPDMDRCPIPDIVLLQSK